MANKESLYLQISNVIRSKITQGELRYGQRIPSERELAELYSVDRKTLRKAVSVLVEEGILTRMHGKGTYINKRQVAYDVNVVDNFGEMLNRSGIKHSCRLLYKEKRSAGLKYAELLNIGENDYVYRLVRLRLGDGEPVAIQNTYIVYDVLEDVEDIDFDMHSLYDVLNQHGVYANRVKETFRFVEFSNQEAKLLNMPDGSWGFMVEDITYDQNQRIVEYTKSFINTEKMIIGVDIEN